MRNESEDIYKLFDKVSQSLSTDWGPFEIKAANNTIKWLYKNGYIKVSKI